MLNSVAECTKNKALEREKGNRNDAAAVGGGGSKSAAPNNHFARKDFKYVTPVLKKDVMTDEVGIQFGKTFFQTK